MSQAEVARRLGVRRAYVGLVCRSVIGRTRGRVSPTAARIAELYALGHFDPEIARQVGCNPQTVARWRRRHNKTSHWKGQLSQAETRSRAVALVASGATFTDAARELGLTKNQVAGAVHRAKQKELE